MIPPTLEQLNLGVENPISLWLIRILSIIFILLATLLFSKFIKNKRYYWILVLTSPVLTLIWLCYPTDAFKIFFVGLIYYLATKIKTKPLVAMGVSIVLIIILNIFVFKERPPILNTLSLSNSQSEVNFRFNIEDNLKPNVYIPLTVKRIVYNKLFISFKNSANEVLKFFDIETVFFQEVNPLGQKAFVIFFWPQIYIFSVSLWLYARKKILIPKGALLLLLLSFVYFITTGNSVDRRLVLTVFPLSIVMSQAITYLFQQKKLIRVSAIAICLLSFYGLTTFYYDLSVRPDFWFDNRPIAYNFALSYLRDNKLVYKQVVVPDTLYAAKKYCQFYLSDCSQFSIENFDTYDNKPKADTLYIGFTGNFLGPNRENASLNEINSVIEGEGLKILSSRHILNNIASGYGQELIIAGPK